MWVLKFTLGIGLALATFQLFAQAPRDEISIAFKLAPLDAKLENPVVTAMALSPDGRYLAAAGDDHAIRIVELENCSTVETLTGHTDWVRSLDFSDDGKILASCGNDCELRVWQTENRFSGRVVMKGAFALSGLSIHPDGDRIFVVGFGNDVECWSQRRSEKVWQHRCECSDHRALEISPNGELVAWGGRDGKLCIFDLLSNDMVFEEAVHSDRIRSLHFSSDSTRVSSIGEDRKLCRYDIPTSKIILSQKIPGGKPMSLALFDMVTTAIGGSDNGIHFYSSMHDNFGRIAGHRGTVSILCCDDKRLYSSGYDTYIRIWDKRDILDRLEATPATKAVSTSAGSEEAVVR